MYELALGVNLYDYGYDPMASGNFNAPSTYWDHLPLSEAKPGDILVKEGHVEMYIGNGQTANFGSSGPAAKIGSNINRFSEVIRLHDVDVNPNGKISSSSDYDEEKDSIYGANGFIYQGVATLSGYESGGTLGKWLFDTYDKHVSEFRRLLFPCRIIISVGRCQIPPAVCLHKVIPSVGIVLKGHIRPVVVLHGHCIRTAEAGHQRSKLVKGHSPCIRQGAILTEIPALTLIMGIDAFVSHENHQVPPFGTAYGKTACLQGIMVCYRPELP